MGNIIKSWNIREGWNLKKDGTQTPSTLHVVVWAALIKKDLGEHLRFIEITLLAE